jgi:hypothetical protein
MDPESDSIDKLMFRFKWVDENTIQIINQEGIEKKVDMKNNFAEIAFNVIPLYEQKQKEDALQDKMHFNQFNFYTNRPSLEI